MKVPSGKKCMIVGCENMVKANDLCATHYQRSLRHGHTDETRHKRGVCSIEGCDRAHVAKGLCQMHYYRLQRAGTTDDPTKAPPRTCEVQGCGKPHAAQGLCEMHYKRLARHGDVIQTRSHDWGARERHPLYTCWNALIRYHRLEMIERWRDLWLFVEDIGASRPSKDHTLARFDEEKPYGPDNVYWREPRVSGASDEAKASRAAYMKGWYQNNKRTVQNSDMMKRYGIGVDEYERMYEAQDGLCAICRKEESRIDHRSKTVSRFAVDHDHASGAVRALLCHSCNNGIGAMGDDMDRVLSGWLYLAQHSADPTAAITAAIRRLGLSLPPSGTA